MLTTRSWLDITKLLNENVLVLSNAINCFFLIVLSSRTWTLSGDGADKKIFGFSAATEGQDQLRAWVLELQTQSGVSALACFFFSFFFNQPAVEGFLCLEVKVHSKGRLLARVQKVNVVPSSFPNCRLKTQSCGRKRCLLVTLRPLPVSSTVHPTCFPSHLTLITTCLHVDLADEWGAGGASGARHISSNAL